MKNIWIYIRLKIAKREIFGLLGHNEAGKSTIIKCILGTKKFELREVTFLVMSSIKDKKKELLESNCQDKIKVKEVCEMTHSLYSEPLDYQNSLKDFWE